MKSRNRNSWRNYQNELQQVGYVRRIWRRIPLRAVTGILLGLLAIFAVPTLYRNAGGLPRHIATDKPAPAAVALSSKKEVAKLLDENDFTNLTEKSIELPVDGQLQQIDTTLDIDLQNYLLQKIDRRHSRYVGIVVMEAATGRVLAMPGFDKTDPAGNPCLDSHFPAASIFKIVTAAAAVNQCGYTADSPVHFSGNKHTLYKRQLANKIDRYTTTVPFRKAFADSVNPVFGKLGGLQLQKPLLEKTADAFGFNEPFDFELPLSPSHFHVSDQPFQWAEVASGFNHETTISPLHGAMMASAVLNNGRMVTPSIVERIVDANGKVLYNRGVEEEQPQAMSAKAATVLREMMETTVDSGTARRSFRNSHRDKTLAGLEIGGKTGSIDSESHDLRYDWFVGFAREPLGQRQVVIAVVVAHEKYIGTRASEYARMAITRYFGNHSDEILLPPKRKARSAAHHLGLPPQAPS